jgi:hypothetical protein
MLTRLRLCFSDRTAWRSSLEAMITEKNNMERVMKDYSLKNSWVVALSTAAEVELL